MERRNFIRALIAVTIGIPIVVEGVTFSTLFYERFSGEKRTQERPDEAVVNEGEELLPGTEPGETVTSISVVETSETEWTYRLEVEIENQTEEPYRLKVGPLSMTDDSTIGDTVSSGNVEPGRSTTFAAEWTIPAEATVDAIWVGGKLGTAESVTELVPVERVEPSG